MKKEIGVGVIGIGMGSALLALNKLHDTRLKVKAICGTTKSKLEKIAKEWNVEFYTTDYKELVCRDDISVVGVYSPDHLHYEHCKAALEAGKHVVCTKPLTDNLDDAIKLVRLVEKTGLKFLVGQTMRYEPQYRTVYEFYERGELGKIIFAEAHYVHDLRPVFDLTPWRLEHPQDFMFGGICHPIDILRWFLGDIGELHAYGCKGGLSKYPLMDNFTINLKFESGVIGRVLGLYGVIEPPEPMMKLVLYGDRMNAIATFSDNKGGEVGLVWDNIEYKPLARMSFPPEHGIDVYGHTKTVIRYMRHFEDCLINNLEPTPGVVDGAKTISVGQAAWESIKEGKAVKVINEF